MDAVLEAARGGRWVSVGKTHRYLGLAQTAAGWTEAMVQAAAENLSLDVR